MAYLFSWFPTEIHLKKKKTVSAPPSPTSVGGGGKSTVAPARKGATLPRCLNNGKKNMR